MGIPAGYSRIVWSGTLTAGEIFETGYWVHQAYTSEDEANSAAVGEASGFASEVQSAVCALISTQSAYTGVKVYSYPTGGPTATFIGEAPIDSAPGTGADSGADQLAIVLTLLTGASGRRNRGRMYLPANGVHPTNGFAAFSVVSAAVDAVAAHFTADNTGGAPPVVLSQVGSSARPITTVRADNRYDIQRRRANKETGAGVHSADV